MMERARIAGDLTAAASAELDVLKARRASPANRIAAARAILAFDPCHEKATRTLMRALLESGDMVALVREYQRCKETLKRRLDAAPSEKTADLYKTAMQQDGTGALARNRPR